jgi:putative DNA primase/helicase
MISEQILPEAGKISGHAHHGAYIEKPRRAKLGVGYYIDAGFSLVPIPKGQKNPILEGWPALRFGLAAFPDGCNIGLNHALSGTAALDLDHPGAEIALKAAGLDLGALLADNPYQVQGNPARTPKAIWRVPEGFTLTAHKLNWPPPESVNPTDRVCIFELRAGKAQDVLPPSIHPDGHTYQWVNDPPAALSDLPELPVSLLKLWVLWDEYAPTMQAACPWAPAQVAKPAPRNSVITEFNQRHSATALLEAHGYTKHGKKYLAPGSSTGMAGITVFDDNRIYSHHGSDPLGDGKVHDAFDVFKILEHGGNEKAAIKAAARMMGIPPSKNTQPKESAPSTTAHQDWPAALPLVAEESRPREYPLDALGGILGAAARDVATQVETPIEIAANTALAGAALAVSGLVQVEVPTGEIKPANLFIATLSASNDRKSTTEKRLLAFARKVQKELDEQARQAAADKTEELRKEKKRGKGQEEVQPAYANVLLNAPTVQAIVLGFQSTPVAAVFSDEGSAMLGGHSMREAETETLATFNKFFDGEIPRDTRVIRNTPPLYNRVLSMHLMIQPGLAAAALMDNKLASQNGFLSRFLIAQPATLRGTRFRRERWHSTPAITQYEERGYRLLSLALMGAERASVENGNALGFLNDGDRKFECERELLTFHPAAANAWHDYKDECEAMAKPGGDYDHVFAQVLRQAEHAARLAGILWRFENEGLEIDVETTRRAIRLARWYRDEAIRIAGMAQPDAELDRAKRLVAWLSEKPAPGGVVRLSDVYQRSPKACKCRKARDARYLLKILAAHNLARECDSATWMLSPHIVSATRTTG